MIKLLSELNLQINRRYGKDIWNIWEVLDLINLEIEAREKVMVHEENNESDRTFSGSALISASNQSNIKKCTNAKKENQIVTQKNHHYPNSVLVRSYFQS